MGRPRGAKNKTGKKHNDPMVEELVEIEVEFDCPVRGKVKQKVKMKKLKPVTTDLRQTTKSSETVEELDGGEIISSDAEDVE